MERFRREIVERSTHLLHSCDLFSADNPLDGLTKLFREIKVKNSIAELSPEYQKFAEWLRIE